MIRFFVDRPVFATVLILLAMAFGALGVRLLPVAQYPDIAPPTVLVVANYNGASAQTAEDNVTQVIEQQLRGIDGLLYFNSSSSSAGQVRIQLSFAQGTNPDTAVVQVQNAVSRSLNRLPQEVQRQGVSVFKSQTDQLMVISLYDSTDRLGTTDVADTMIRILQDPISRINGVGETSVFGAQYAMRIWLDPYRLRSFGLTPTDVRTAIEAQNAQVAAGELGAAPAPDEQAINATITARSRLRTASEFESIVLRASTGGGLVYLRDVARVEVGSENYLGNIWLNGHPAAGMSITLASGANALDTALRVRAEVERLGASLPDGIKVAYPRDSVPFVQASIDGVTKTLIEAVVLVIAIIFLFLQNVRATLVPAITVPVVLLSTFAMLWVLDYSINTLTMFATVLAIGLVVDDAIVVVENIERIMRDERLGPREATLKSMAQISSALVGIAVVLAAVFVPMSFMGGSVGVIYRQFSVTLIVAMALSAVVALTLAPSMSAALLKAHGDHPPPWVFRQFNRGFDGFVGLYRRVAGLVTAHWVVMLLVFALLVGAMAWIYSRMPTSFLPVEDQGTLTVQFTTPVGTPLAKTEEVAQRIGRWFVENEARNVDVVMVVAGRNQAGVGQNAGQAFASLKHWRERPGEQNSARAVIQRARTAFREYQDAQVSVSDPPPVRGLGQSAGFELWLQDQFGAGRDALNQAKDALLDKASADSRLDNVRANTLDDRAQLQVSINQVQASLLGLSAQSINETLTIAWGGLYVNDYVDRGRIKRVYLQGDAPFRASPDNLNEWTVRGASGTMAPFSSFASASWTVGPQLLQRFNGVPAIQIQGGPARDSSSGEAMQRMEDTVKSLPAAGIPEMGVQWSGLSYQERLSGANTMVLYLASAAFVFLCLAALYESWAVPAAVILVVPLGALGAVLATVLARFPNDVYFQVGLLTTFGLAAKNAILIVEFARQLVKEGREARDAVIEAARMRLRPIIMTSLAFVAGVLPLVHSTGAGAVSRQEIGVAVTGGMISGTLLAILFVPVFFVVVQRFFVGRGKASA